MPFILIFLLLCPPLQNTVPLPKTVRAEAAPLLITKQGSAVFFTDSVPLSCPGQAVIWSTNGSAAASGQLIARGYDDSKSRHIISSIEKLRIYSQTCPSEQYPSVLECIEQYSRALGMPEHALRSPAAGIVITECDGLEAVWDGTVPSELTLSVFRSKLRQEKTAPAQAKLLCGSRLYCAFVFSGDDSVTFRLGEKYSIITQSERLTMELIHCEKEGEDTLLCFYRTGIPVSGMPRRAQTAQLVTDETVGIPLPETALLLSDDGIPYVYALHGELSLRRHVDIIHYSGGTVWAACRGEEAVIQGRRCLYLVENEEIITEKGSYGHLRNVR